MITDKLNRWVTMFVNLSVLAGIVLVAIQIQQNTDITKAQMANEYYLLDAQ
jgi:negative regulator of sigma E activity